LATAYNGSRWSVYISIRLGDKKEKNDSNENENKQTTIGNANVTCNTGYSNDSNGWYPGQIQAAGQSTSP
jgi:hypothetical protein